MRGDKLVIERHHTERAQEIAEIIIPEIQPPYVITIAGESGSGKSELASELARILLEGTVPAEILQQDDYFVFPPKTNHEMRRANINQVGPQEVKLDFLEANLRSFKRGEGPLFKPLVDYEADAISTEEFPIAGVEVLIAEGTYTSLLRFVDLRIFLDLDFRATLRARKRRARDTFEPFVEDVLAREHRIISKHKDRADLIVPAAFDRVIDVHKE